MPTFAQERQTNYYATALDHFAEQVTYQPLSGPARTVTVKIHASEVLDEQTIPGIRDLERIQVACGRIESHAKGGVDRPRAGDSLVRAGETRAYGFDGEVLSSTPHSWSAVFSRPRVRQLGSEQRSGKVA